MDRHRTLAHLSDDDWLRPDSSSTQLYRDLCALRDLPVGQLTPTSLHLLVTHQVGLDVTALLALEHVEGDPLRSFALYPGDLLAAGHVPQAELGAESAVGLATDGADHQRLSGNRAPLGEARHARGCRGRDAARVERDEQPRADEVIGDHRGHVGSDLGVAGERREDRDRDRDRLDLPLGDVELEDSMGRTDRAGRDGEARDREENAEDARRAAAR